jgi:hypothetical protein
MLMPTHDTPRHDTGKDTHGLQPLRDKRLLEWWLLPMHQEEIVFDTQPPRVVTANTSLWNLGNRYVAASREVNFAAQVLACVSVSVCVCTHTRVCVHTHTCVC